MVIPVAVIHGRLRQDACRECEVSLGTEQDFNLNKQHNTTQHMKGRKEGGREREKE